jgi:outer membrane protein assembly factor BamE
MIKDFTCAVALSIVAASTIGCLRVYVPDIQQGNVITQEMVNQLKVGMNRRQVQFILGTPLLTDPFHQDRWDYYYSLKRGKKYRAKRTLSLFFKGDELAEIRGDVKPKAQGTSETGTKPAGSS